MSACMNYIVSSGLFLRLGIWKAEFFFLSKTTCLALIDIESISLQASRDESPYVSLSLISQTRCVCPCLAQLGSNLCKQMPGMHTLLLLIRRFQGALSVCHGAQFLRARGVEVTPCFITIAYAHMDSYAFPFPSGSLALAAIFTFSIIFSHLQLIPSIWVKHETPSGIEIIISSMRVTLSKDDILDGNLTSQILNLFFNNHEFESSYDH
jgi:hypothetical protein